MPGPNTAGPPSPTLDGARVLLVDPYLRREDPMERQGEEQYPSLGVLSLAAYLRHRGADVRVVDLTFERDLGRVREALGSFRPEVVGVHTKTLTLERSLALARLAREAGAFTVAGGPDASSRVDRYLRSGFDAVVTGEGETTLVDLVHARNEGSTLFGIPGVAFLHEGSSVQGPPRSYLPDLDALPLPAWDLIDLEGYLDRWSRLTGDRRMAVVTSRGCPFDCSWCSKPTFGRTFRQRSVGSLMHELAMLRELYGVDYVRVCDDVFGIQRAWTEEFLEEMIARDWGMRFECLSRVDLLKPELLPRLKRAGLARVFLGVESGSQKMLDLMNRGTRLTQVERCARALKEHGVRQHWFLMLGYPGETLADIESTVELFRRYSPEEYSVSVALPLPGTRFERLVQGSPATGENPLLFEGVDGEIVHRWTRGRLRFWRRMAPFASHFRPSTSARLERASDWFGQEVARRIVVGEEAPRVPPRREEPRQSWLSRPPGEPPRRPAA